MSMKKELIDRIEHFYIDVVEEFKEAEQQIINDSKFSSMFRKKNYDSNIEKLKSCKKTALEIEVKDLNPEDEEGEDVLTRFNRALAMFNALCDAYIQLQVFLKKKAAKEDAKLSVYKEIMAKVQQNKMATNVALHDLDIVYTEYVETAE